MKLKLVSFRAKTTKKIVLFLCLLFCIILTAEILLRCIWGFGKMPLYVKSDKYEYMFAPNQEMTRFGKYFFTNSYCQRNQEPDSTKIIILGIGDSVINGGSQTHNDSLATNIISKETDFQMLNISAGSWGPDNCAAYLKQWGTFNAKAIFVLLSSHDANDIMDFSPTVGIHKSFPAKQYPLAILEVIDRYIIPRLIPKGNNLDPDQKVLKGIDKGEKFNNGWKELKSIAENANIPLIVILHAEISEIRKQEYNNKGQIIEKWASDNNIKLIKDISYLQESHYRDQIHINNRGQRVIADIIKQELKLIFKN